MFHTMLETLAVAVTDTVPSLAEAVIGPNVSSLGLSTHIHTGSPTSPARSGPDSGTIPILIGSRSIEAMARCARITGSMNAVPFSTQAVPANVPPPLG